MMMLLYSGTPIHIYYLKLLLLLFSQGPITTISVYSQVSIRSTLPPFQLVMVQSGVDGNGGA